MRKLLFAVVTGLVAVAVPFVLALPLSEVGWTVVGLAWLAFNCALAAERGRRWWAWLLVGLLCPPFIVTGVLVYLPSRRTV
jgi:hypothetical protein